jgi:methylase of polypeptide subunit release factors
MTTFSTFVKKIDENNPMDLAIKKGAKTERNKTTRNTRKSKKEHLSHRHLYEMKHKKRNFLSLDLKAKKTILVIRPELENWIISKRTIFESAYKRRDITRCINGNCRYNQSHL